MVIPTVDHECALTPVVVELTNKIAQLEHQLAQLKKAQYGPRSERTKMPRVPSGASSTPEQRLAKRRTNARDKAQTETVRIEHKVPPEKRICPKCGSTELKPFGPGRTSYVFEFVPARFVRHEHVQEVLRCRCDYVVTAPGEPKVIEKGRYGASFLAHLAVAKCADHIPIYRLEKDFRRQGFPLARSTMNELLHRASELTRPLWTRLMDDIRVRPIVMADETSLRMQDDGTGKAKTGFVWTFVAADADGQQDVAFVYAADRSGETPRRVLGDTDGYLLVDAYSGYNSVAEVSRRVRAACHAHLRRYFHEALATAPVAQEAIDIILELYAVEREASVRQIVGTAEHQALRRRDSAAARARLKAWLDVQAERHPPKSPIGEAIRYALNHWDELGRFLDDARIPLDNNASERSLRRVALGRKNYLFVGGVDAGTSIAGLYTLIATCEARGINPFAYLADVIPRVQDHPAKRIEELLPSAWACAQAPP